MRIEMETEARLLCEKFGIAWTLAEKEITHFGRRCYITGMAEASQIHADQTKVAIDHISKLSLALAKKALALQ